MRIIKECQDSTFKPKGLPEETRTNVFLHTDPSMNLKTLTELFNEAKKDFPTLTEGDVTVSRFEPLKGISKMIADKQGPVSFDGIQFEAPSTPPREYKRLKPTGYAQG
jgi:hypothetical protein